MYEHHFVSQIWLPFHVSSFIVLTKPAQPNVDTSTGEAAGNNKAPFFKYNKEPVFV
jgi:hypothetical protein